jgi:hypothetical protein
MVMVVRHRRQIGNSYPIHSSWHKRKLIGICFIQVIAMALSLPNASKRSQKSG